MPFKTNPPEPNIHDFPWLKGDTGVDPNKLGAVMLPVGFRKRMLERGYELGIISESDLYTSENPDLFWIKGDVTERAHVTLLYGLLTPAYEQAETIARLLQDWKAPDWLPIVSFEAFPSTIAGEPYACIVARVGDRYDYLAEARGRLEYLPHVNTFPTWKLHATVAYVQADAAERWLEFLGSRVSPVVEVPLAESGASILDLGSVR